MIGWLLDTNVVSALINPDGASSVKAWATGQDEGNLFLSVLTLGEYDKGIFNLAGNHPDRQRYIASRDALEARFAGRILSVGDMVVRRWGRISGRIKTETGHPPQVIDTLLAATAIEHDRARHQPGGRHGVRSLERRSFTVSIEPTPQASRLSGT